MTCRHSLSERETAVADGMCPMCLAAVNAELLEALKAAIERIPTEHDFDHTPSDDAAREQVSAAIAKAEGRT